MKKISEYYHKELGKIVCCVSDNEYGGNYWCKKEKFKFFSKEPQNIHILFDLYNRDNNYQRIKKCKKALQEEKKIIENYQLFVNSLEEIEKFCLLSFQNPDTPFDYYYYSIIDYELPKVNTIEELCQYVRVVQVYISSECYEVRLQFLYSPMDTIIHGHLNDNSKSEMGIKLANDLIGVNTIIETE